MSEKVKEIKKKLQEEIFIANSFGDKLRKVPTKELENLLTLINELERENERLEKELKQVVLCNKGLQDGINEYQADNKEIGKSNQQLKNRIAELEKENETKTDTITDLLKKQEFYEKDKLKQFAEKLRKKVISLNVWEFGEIDIIDADDIDEVLKEYKK